MVIRPLTAGDFDASFAAFNEAFSDYVVPLTLTREQFAEMLQRRGWVPEASVAAFDDERMVAFTLNGIDGDRGYDSGTGVVPAHRRCGLARELMLQSIELLRARGCGTYVLEVIDSNVKAAELYRSLGFVETRGLQCWRFEAHRRTGSEAHSTAEGSVSLCAYEPVSLWWDIAPSWQNTPSSIHRASFPHQIIGDEDSYAVVFANGDVPQLAVRPDARRKGLGTRLLHAAAAAAGQPVRMQNVDERHEGITRFLESAGATRTVRQLEMMLAL